MVASFHIKQRIRSEVKTNQCTIKCIYDCWFKISSDIINSRMSRIQREIPKGCLNIVLNVVRFFYSQYATKIGKIRAFSNTLKYHRQNWNVLLDMVY